MGLRVAIPTQEEIKIVRERLTEIDKGILMEKFAEKKVVARSNLGKSLRKVCKAFEYVLHKIFPIFRYLG